MNASKRFLMLHCNDEKNTHKNSFENSFNKPIRHNRSGKRGARESERDEAINHNGKKSNECLCLSLHTVNLRIRQKQTAVLVGFSNRQTLLCRICETNPECLLCECRAANCPHKCGIRCFCATFCPELPFF